MADIRFTETILRDATQSLIATRMPFEKFEPVLHDLDNANYYSLECWGGATFDSCLRYLNEDPWERLRKIKAVCKKTKLQMLLRGQNLVAYKHFPDDVVRAFISRAVANGIDVIRIFDALNDLRNLQTAIDETLKNKAEAQVAVSYTVSPIHNIEYFINLAGEMENMGASSLCIKDMAGILNPVDAYNLVRGIKEKTNLRLHVHTHCTTGMGYMTYLKAIEAGADVIDTAISCFSGGTSQPATETMGHLVKYMGKDSGVNFGALKKINDYFKEVQEEYIKSGLLDPYVLSTDAEALEYQIPGGMLSNLVSQLKAQNAIDRLEEVLHETPRVREEMGYPPLVTPLSQMVGVQAVNNILSGERYKNISKEIKAYIKGEYGKAPGQIDYELSSKVLEGSEPFAGRPADLLLDGMKQGRADTEGIARSEDDVLSYILFPQVALKYFGMRGQKEENKVRYIIQRI
ncbi:MAG: pyruvate carboxylase subunit B [Clostridiales bacterium]|jgi:oxaloacetate decarboxylase alpha subunit|nr:pyruvate carboxylase subunit B [Clostridiales bacterium]